MHRIPIAILALPLLLTGWRSGVAGEDGTRPPATDPVIMITPQPRATTDPIARRAQAHAAFACALYARLADPAGGNLFFSPYSVASALDMTMAGAAGQTLAEMRTALAIDLSDADLAPADAAVDAALAPRPVVEWTDDGKATVIPFALAVANRMWAAPGYPIAPAFAQLCAAHYGSGIDHVDFLHAEPAARATINAWVAQRTADRIRELLTQPLARDTRLVLVNAVHFKSSWAEGGDFAKAATAPAPFSAARGAVEVPMMRRRGHLATAAISGGRVVVLPYRGEQVEMVLIVPDAPDGLPMLERGLDRVRLDAWRAAAAQSALVDLHLPRFTLRGAFDLAPTLGDLGMRRAFTDAAEFGRMTSAPEGLKIGSVIHQTWLAVDEDGTEAAAATAVAMAAGVAPRREEPLLVRCDRPFLFMLRHVATGTVLFMGRLADPSAG